MLKRRLVNVGRRVFHRVVVELAGNGAFHLRLETLDDFRLDGAIGVGLAVIDL